MGRFLQTGNETFCTDGNEFDKMEMAFIVGPHHEGWTAPCSGCGSSRTP